MTTMKKRGAVYGVIGLMLCVAVYLNWSYFQTPGELTVADQAAEPVKKTGAVYGEVTAVDHQMPAAEKEEDYFSKARLSRQTARDEALTMLKQTVTDEKATEEARNKASDTITKLAGDMVKEERMESRIKAKGYRDAVVSIAEDAISAVVAPKKKGLTAADAAAISDIIVSETGAEPSVIRISEAK